MIREVIDNRDNLRYGVWELWERWKVIHAPSGIEPSSHVADEPSALPGTCTRISVLQRKNVINRPNKQTLDSHW